MYVSFGVLSNLVFFKVKIKFNCYNSFILLLKVVGTAMNTRRSYLIIIENNNNKTISTQSWLAFSSVGTQLISAITFSAMYGFLCCCCCYVFLAAFYFLTICFYFHSLLFNNVNSSFYAFITLFGKISKFFLKYFVAIFKFLCLKF